MKHLPFCHPGDFDDNGLLKAPVLFWVGLVVMARAWWLSGLMVMMAPAGDTQVGFLWPDIGLRLAALAAGVPGMVMLFIYPLRERYLGLARASYVVILAALLVMVMVDIAGVIAAAQPLWDMGWLLFCLDLSCMVMLWPDRRLRAVFFGDGSSDQTMTKSDVQ
ncbi:DUF2919 domain-containing protein [Salmonella enterica]|nr:DUF2919 domain-containing protein [Salmonella enterica]